MTPTLKMRPIIPSQIRRVLQTQTQWDCYPGTHTEIPGTRKTVSKPMWGVPLIADFDGITPDMSIIFFADGIEPTFSNTNPYQAPSMLTTPWMGHPVPTKGTVGITPDGKYITCMGWFLMPGHKTIFARLSVSHLVFQEQTGMWNNVGEILLETERVTADLVS